MKKMKFLIPVAAVAFLFASCGDKCCSSQSSLKGGNNQVLTAEQQSALTPDEVIAILKQGNAEFVANKLTVRNNTEVVAEAANGQFPKAVILSCLDSRVPVEDVFHRAIGDVFVARVAGNIANPDILGSMEFACAAAGAKLVVVMGHGACGAVKGSIADVVLGNLTGLLNRIKPAVEASKADFTGDASADNIEFVDHVALKNVAMTIGEIRANSPTLKAMEDEGAIKIVGAFYNMHTGAVEFFENM